MASEKERTVLAFDAAAIHAGNYALTIDHNTVAQAADALVDKMTLDQKLNELRGRQLEPIDALYYAGGDDTLGLAPWKMVDGPRGARAGKSTAFPVSSRVFNPPITNGHPPLT